MKTSPTGFSMITKETGYEEVPIVPGKNTAIDDKEEQKQIDEDLTSSTCALGKVNRIHIGRKAGSMHDNNQKPGECFDLNVYGRAHQNGLPLNDVIAGLSTSDTRRLKIEALTHRLMQKPMAWMKIRAIIKAFPTAYKMDQGAVSSIVTIAKKVNGFVHFRQRGGNNVWEAMFNPSSFRPKDEKPLKKKKSDRPIIISKERQAFLMNLIRKYKEWAFWKDIYKFLPDELKCPNTNSKWYARELLQKNLKGVSEWEKIGSAWKVKYTGNEEYVLPIPDEVKIDPAASLTDDNHASIDDELSTEASPPDNGKGSEAEVVSIVEKLVSGLTSNGKISLSKWCDIGAAMLSAAAAEIRKP